MRRYINNFKLNYILQNFYYDCEESIFTFFRADFGMCFQNKITHK